MSEADKTPQSINLDLSSAMLLESAFIDINFPGSEPPKPTGWQIEIAGPAHKKTTALQDELMRERLRRDAAKEQAQTNFKKWKADEETPAERRQRAVQNTVCRIISWRMVGPPDEAGERPVIGVGPIIPQVQPDPIAFSEEAASKLLLRQDMGWVFGQIAEYLGSEKAFTQGSATI